MDRMSLKAAEGSMSVEMEDNATDLNQVIVTGYQTQKETDLYRRSNTGEYERNKRDSAQHSSESPAEPRS